MLLPLQPLIRSFSIFQPKRDIVQRRVQAFLLHKLHHIQKHLARSKQDPPERTRLPKSRHDPWVCLIHASHNARNSDAPMRSNSFERLWQRLRAHDIKNMVQAALLRRQRLGHLAPVRLVPVVDDMLRAKRPESVRSGRRARDSDDIGTGRYSNLTAYRSAPPFRGTEQNNSPAKRQH